MLTPVPNPAAYGLVETDAGGRVRRFIEKPDPSQITTDTINAGIYVLETTTLALMPPGVNHSIERGFFPALLARGDRVPAYVHRGYWIDIGTPEKYLQVHRDILGGRFPVAAWRRALGGGWIASPREVEDGRRAGRALLRRARAAGWRRARAIGPGAVLTAGVRVGGGRPRRATACSGKARRSGAGARVRGRAAGPPACSVGRNAPCSARAPCWARAPRSRRLLAGPA